MSRASVRALLPRLPLRWALLALGFAGIALVQQPHAAGPGVGVEALPYAVLGAGVWTAAVALAVGLTRRYPVDFGSRSPSLAIHVAAAAAIGVAHHLAASRLAGWHALTEDGHAVSDFFAAFSAYFLFAGVAHAVELRRRLREKELAELRLQAELSEAELERARYELQALKMELNPHFLFNSLHAISALMHQDAKLANRMLVRVSELLRRALASVGTQRVTLEEELDFARLFLEVEEVRFDGRLQVVWEVEEEARAMSVPHMILQPLVENAVKHGIAPRGAGRITVRATRHAGDLRLEVEDDGVGLREAGPPEPGSGVGLRNIRERLQQLAGDDRGFELGPAAGGGVLAVVAIPGTADPRSGDFSVQGETPRPVSEPTPVQASRSAVRPGAMGALCFLATWALGIVSLSERPGGAGGAQLAAEVLAAGLNAAMLALLVAAAFSRTRRFPIRSAQWRSALPVHLRAAIAIAIVAIAAKAAGRLLMGFPAGEILPTSLPALLLGYLFLYAVVAAVAQAFLFARRFREKEAAELRLRRDLSHAEVQRTRAELQILKIELNPHFLFSALHAISALIPQDLKLANRIVVRLSEVLRGALRNRGAREIPLEDEVSGLEPLLEIESIRWADRLRVEWDIEEEALDARVPPMLLQSLVEHLLQHGVALASQERHISIAARHAGPSLELELCDRGVAGLNEPAAPGAASGLDAVRVRLQQLYGEAHRLEVRGGEEAAGVTIAVALPWREEETPDDADAATSASRAPLVHAFPR